MMPPPWASLSLSARTHIQWCWVTASQGHPPNRIERGLSWWTTSVLITPLWVTVQPSVCHHPACLPALVLCKSGQRKELCTEFPLNLGTTWFTAFIINLLLLLLIVVLLHLCSYTVKTKPGGEGTRTWGQPLVPTTTPRSALGPSLNETDTLLRDNFYL